MSVLLAVHPPRFREMRSGGDLVVVVVANDRGQGGGRRLSDLKRCFCRSSLQRGLFREVVLLEIRSKLNSFAALKVLVNPFLLRFFAPLELLVQQVKRASFANACGKFSERCYLLNMCAHPDIQTSQLESQGIGLMSGPSVYSERSPNEATLWQLVGSPPTRKKGCSPVPLTPGDADAEL